MFQAITARAGRSALALFAASVACAVVTAGPANAQYDVPYVPTPQSVVDAMLEMGEVESEDYVIDLGSGDGRIVVTAAKELGARGMGVDLNPQRIKEANENAEKAGVTDMVEFKQQNLFETDISKASVLTMYLLPDVNLRLKPVILDTLAPGTRVVSHAFDMGEWEPDETRTVDNKRIFLWIVPAKVDGSWSLEGEGIKGGELVLTQDHQKIDGSVEMEGNTRKIADAKVEGQEINFSMPGPGGEMQSFTGKVEGDRITGETEDGASWSASRNG